MKRLLLSLAVVALVAGCSGGASTTVPNHSTGSTGGSGALRAPRYNGGPGTTSLTYYDTYSYVLGQCSPGVLSLMNGRFPVTSLSFAAGDGPPLVVSNCNFQTPQYVHVSLGTPDYGAPFIRQSDYTVTVDAPDSAKVVATWTALGPTLPGTPGLSGTVSYTIGPPDGGGL